MKERPLMWRGFRSLLKKNKPYLSFEPEQKKPTLEFDAGKNSRLSKDEIALIPWKIVDELMSIKL